jgi:YHS domain-containing protein
MLLRSMLLAALSAGLFGLADPVGNAQDKPKPADLAKAKKALQEVQDFIGLWNLEGTQKADGKTIAWKEKVNWGWKFKDGEAWITVSFGDEGKGKYFSHGDLKYNVEKKKYVLNLVGADKTELPFEGTVQKGSAGGLKLERKDEKTGDVYRLTMNTLADGIRFQMKFDKQDGGKGLFSNVFAFNGNKDGESIGGGSKKPECIVSGGAANIPVTYQGKTYYVCCTGCRDEFNANPAKYTKGK